MPQHKAPQLGRGRDKVHPAPAGRLAVYLGAIPLPDPVLHNAAREYHSGCVEHHASEHATVVSGTTMNGRGTS